MARRYDDLYYLLECDREREEALVKVQGILEQIRGVCNPEQLDLLTLLLDCPSSPDAGNAHMLLSLADLPHWDWFTEAFAYFLQPPQPPSGKRTHRMIVEEFGKMSDDLLVTTFNY